MSSPPTAHVYFEEITHHAAYSSLLFSALATMSEIPSLYSQREIVLRHEKAALYHPFVEALAHTLVDVPITLVIMIVFSVLLYFMTGLQRSAEQFLYVFSSFIGVRFVLTGFQHLLLIPLHDVLDDEVVVPRHCRRL